MLPRVTKSRSYLLRNARKLTDTLCISLAQSNVEFFIRMRRRSPRGRYSCSPRRNHRVTRDVLGRHWRKDRGWGKRSSLAHPAAAANLCGNGPSHEVTGCHSNRGRRSWVAPKARAATTTISPCPLPTSGSSLRPQLCPPWPSGSIPTCSSRISTKTSRGLAPNCPIT